MWQWSPVPRERPTTSVTAVRHSPRALVCHLPTAMDSRPGSPGDPHPAPGVHSRVIRHQLKNRYVIDLTGSGRI